MLTLKEQIDLMDKVANDDISASLAKEVYWKGLKASSRSWQTQDWKERRKTFLKDKCEICNGNDILTIQHLSHPRSYNDYENEVTRKYLSELKDSNSMIQKSKFLDHIIKNYDYSPVPLCPKCQSRKPNKRVKKELKYFCTKCHSEFNETTFLSVEKLVDIFYENKDTIEIKDKCFISKDKWKNQHSLKEISYWLFRNETKTSNFAKIEKEAFLLYLDANIKYLSFDDSITACKKCASNYDLKNLELCPNCKLLYKGTQYPTCIQCLPEDKQKKALDKIAFGKQIHEIHKVLRID
jgi:hypothetical protein